MATASDSNTSTLASLTSTVTAAGNPTTSTSVSAALTPNLSAALNTSVTSTAEPSIYLCEIEPQQCEALQKVKLGLISVAFIFSVLTLAIAVIFRKFKRFSQRIFLQILVANILEDITYLGHDGRIPGYSCIAQGFFIQFTSFVVFLWVVSLTVYLLLIIVKDTERAKVESFEWLFVLCCWVGPVAIACLPLTTGDYGPASAPYCWIVDRDSGQVWRFIIYWIPVMVGIVGILIAFIYMYWKTKQNLDLYSQDAQGNHAARLRELKTKYLKPLTYYAAAFVVLHFFQFINRVQNTINEIPVYGLMVAHVVSQFGYGLVLCALFFIVNGASEFSRLKLKESLSEYREYGLFHDREKTVQPYNVDYDNQSASGTLPANGSPSSRPSSYLSARGSSPGDDRPTLRISYIEDGENTINAEDLPIGDIRTYDTTRLDTISLDSNDSQHQSDTRK